MPIAVRTKKFVLKPANPQADPRFKSVKEKVGQKSAQLKKHPPAKQKPNEAAKAAKRALTSALKSRSPLRDEVAGIRFRRLINLL